MKALLKPYKEKSKILGVESAYLNQIANGFRKPSAKLAVAMRNLLGIPLHISRPDLFEANDATNHNNQQRPMSEGVNE